jgi:hypothetical protein
MQASVLWAMNGLWVGRQLQAEFLAARGEVLGLPMNHYLLLAKQKQQRRRRSRSVQLVFRYVSKKVSGRYRQKAHRKERYNRLDVWDLLLIPDP